MKNFFTTAFETLSPEEREAYHRSVFLQMDTERAASLRAEYYRERLRFMGRDVGIGPGVTLENPENISLGDQVQIEQGCTLMARSERGITLGEKTRLKHRVYLDTENAEGYIETGKRVYIGTGCCLHGHRGLEIGDDTLLAQNITITPYSHHFEDPTLPIIKQGGHRRRIVIGRDCYLGMGVCVLWSADIGEGSVIGSGSVVVKPVPPYSVAVGVPAKVIRKRGPSPPDKPPNGSITPPPDTPPTGAGSPLPDKPPTGAGSPLPDTPPNGAGSPLPDTPPNGAGSPLPDTPVPQSSPPPSRTKYRPTCPPACRMHRHPAHMPPIRKDHQPVVLLVTVCVHPRRDVLATPAVHESLVMAWNQASSWHVGEYMIMPDHLHLFCTPGELEGIPVQRWVRYWKRLAGQGNPVLKQAFQENCWDTQMRNRAHYEEKLHYVRENPTRRSLIKIAKDWPYQGCIHAISWL